MKEEKNKITKIIIGIVVGILIIFFAIYVSNSQQYKSKGLTYLKTVSYSEYKELMTEDEDNVFLFASPSCTHCIAYKPEVSKLASEYEKNIYYVNVGNLDENEYLDIINTYSVLKEQGSIPTPTTVITKNGKEVSGIMGNIGYDGLQAFLTENGVKYDYMKNITFEDYQELKRRDVYSIFVLGRPTCGHCLEYKPLVLEAATENNVKVYYLDVSLLNEDNIHEIVDSYSVLKKEQGIPTPTTVITKNNKEVSSIIGNVGKDGFISFIKENKVI